MLGKCGKGTGCTGASSATTDLKVKCDMFNRFFVSCATNLRSICSTTVHAFKKWLPQTNNSEIFTFQQFTDLEVRTALRELIANKATGVYGISSRLLKDGADVLAYPLTFLFNLSVQQCKIPGEWKKAKVMPLYKSGAKSDPKNFRPISVLPVVSKVYERLVHNQLASYFDENNLLCTFQSGFRKKHSTETAVTYFADQILMGMDKGLVVGAVFI